MKHEIIFRGTAILCIYFIWCHFQISAQSTISSNTHSKYMPTIVNPPYWWTDMGQDEIELMANGFEIANCKVRIDHPGVKFQSITSGNEKNVAFIKLKIEPTLKHGACKILFTKNDSAVYEYIFNIYKRRTQTKKALPISKNDVIYQVSLDRFVNANTKNDDRLRYTEKVNMSSQKARHGGDLQGLLLNLRYIKSLGNSGVLINSLAVSNHPQSSFLSGFTTSAYQVDLRYLEDADVKKLEDSIHRLDLKLMMTVPFNTVSFRNEWINYLPLPEWITQQDIINDKSNKRQPQLFSEASQTNSTNWFFADQPRLNLDNPHIIQSLAQNSIWWIEFLNLSGIALPYQARVESRENIKKYEDIVKRSFPDIYIENNFPKTIRKKDKIVESIWHLDYQYLKDSIFNGEMMNTNFMLPSSMPVLGRMASQNKNGLNEIKQMRTLQAIFPKPIINVYGDELLLGNATSSNANFWIDFQKENTLLDSSEKEEFKIFLTAINKMHHSLDTSDQTQFYIEIPNENITILSNQSAKKRVVMLVNNSDKDYKLDVKQYPLIFPLDNPLVLFDVVSSKQYYFKDKQKIKANSFLILESRR